MSETLFCHKFVMEKKILMFVTGRKKEGKDSERWKGMNSGKYPQTAE